MAAPAEPSEGEAMAVAGEERPSDVVSKETGPKPPTPEAKPAAKPVKKAAKKKKEEPTPVAAATESLSLGNGTASGALLRRPGKSREAKLSASIGQPNAASLCRQALHR